MVQNHALLQSPPETASHGYHFITAAQATQQMNYRVPEEGENGGNCWWERPLVVALKHSEGIKHTVLFQQTNSLQY